MHLSAPLMPLAFGILSLFATATFAAPLTSELATRRPSYQGQCDLSSAALPKRGSPPELPSPPSGLRLKYVALSLGTQNHACFPDGPPTSTGAVAALFDISCIYKDGGTIRSLTESNLRGNGGKPRSPDDIKARLKGTLPLLADHYFADGLPFFDFRPYGRPDEASVRLAEKVPSPSNNNVDWLQLVKTTSHGIEVRFNCSQKPSYMP
jgi:hypothetical protein